MQRKRCPKCGRTHEATVEVCDCGEDIGSAPRVGSGGSGPVGGGAWDAFA